MAPTFKHTVSIGGAFVLLFHVYRVSTMDCGMTNFVRPAILGGTQAIKGEWPFIAAVYNRSNYICGGTVISYRHILTAAHCIQRKRSEVELLPPDVIVRLGAYNLTKPNERGAIHRNVSAIFVHPDWDAFSDSFDADIAILILDSNVTFTDDIQPVCMPASGVGESIAGTVVGYGVRRKTSYAEIPRRIIVNVLNSSHCFREDDVLRLYSSERTFCGGNGDGSPELGDSGGGYFFTPGFSWAQYGIVALLRSNRTGHVSSHSYHAYTNVTMFKNWIIETVNRTGGTVGEARTNIIMHCDYGNKNLFSLETVYSCELHSIDIQGNNFETDSFVGTHPHVETEHDVEGIHFVNGTMTYLPSGFGMVFENIKHLVVGHPDSETLGTKVVRRTDLRNLKQLQRLTFLRNDIETLHEDAMWDLPDLRIIVFVENKLKVLHSETFSRNWLLLEINFRSNNLSFLPANLFRFNPSLNMIDFRDNFLQLIDDATFRANRRLVFVDLSSNLLTTLPKRLFQNNSLLELVAVNSNDLSSIDEDLFETNAMLLGAQFAYNRIESLPRVLFRNNVRLYFVEFRNNSIGTIDSELFVNNRRLQIISLGENRIEHLHRNVFAGNPLLKELDLSGNRLKIVSVSFDDFEQISRVDLRRNDCIHAVHMKQNASNDTIDNLIGNLTEFKKKVTANCSYGVIV